LRGAHGRDVREALQARRRDQDAAERAVRATGVRDVRGGAVRPRADPAARSRQLHVGVRLPAPRQHVAALAAGDRARARQALPGGRAPGDRRELPEAVPAALSPANAAARRREWAAVGALMLLGFALRVWFALAMEAHPAHQSPILDSAFHV